MSSVPSVSLGCNTSLVLAVCCNEESFADLSDAAFLLITLSLVIFRLCWGGGGKNNGAEDRKAHHPCHMSTNNPDARAKNHFLSVLREVNTCASTVCVFLHAHTYRH